MGGRTCLPPGFGAMFFKLRVATADMFLGSTGWMRWACLRNPVGYNMAEGSACSEQQPWEETLMCMCVCVCVCVCAFVCVHAHSGW